MSQSFTIYEGILHLSLDATEYFNQIAQQGKVATIANTLRSEDSSLSIDESRNIAKIMVSNPGQTSYNL